MQQPEQSSVPELQLSDLNRMNSDPCDEPGDEETASPLLSLCVCLSLLCPSSLALLYTLSYAGHADPGRSWLCRRAEIVDHRKAEESRTGGTGRRKKQKSLLLVPDEPEPGSQGAQGGAAAGGGCC